MAEKLVYRLNIAYSMSNKNPKSGRAVISTFSTRIKEVSAQAYINAADSAARSASSVGTLIHQTNLLTLGTPMSWGISFDVEETTAVPPLVSDAAYPFDKFAVSLLAAGENSQVTIPARDMSVVTLETDGITVQTGAAIPDDWITAYEAIALDEDLNSPTVERIFVVR
jgi:hypothetical protein